MKEISISELVNDNSNRRDHALKKTTKNDYKKIFIISKTKMH